LGWRISGWRIAVAHASQDLRLDGLIQQPELMADVPAIVAPGEPDASPRRTIA
jgi:hypothetical protein